MNSYLKFFAAFAEQQQKHLAATKAHIELLHGRIDFLTSIIQVIIGESESIELQDKELISHNLLKSKISGSIKRILRQDDHAIDQIDAIIERLKTMAAGQEKDDPSSDRASGDDTDQA